VRSLARRHRMAWWHGFLFIPFVLYIGAIVTAFNERWSAALMMLYMGSISCHRARGHRLVPVYARC
jgi:hypothetical protein